MIKKSRRKAFKVLLEGFFHMLQSHFSVSDMSELQINRIIATENIQLGLTQASKGPKGFISKAFTVYMSS